MRSPNPPLTGRRRRERERRVRIPFPVAAMILVAVSRSAQAQYVRPSGVKRMSPELEARASESQASKSTEIWMTGYDDFCLFGPPDPFNQIWNAGLNVVSWCSKDGHGTRLIPDGTLHGVTYIKAKDWIQVSGTGDFTKLNIAPGDYGGQFDSKDKAPQGAKVHLDGDKEASSWVTLISANTFCMRACTGDSAYCSNQYPEQGCWFLTGNNVGPAGTWQNCESDNGNPPGVSNGKTFSQEDPALPTPTAPTPSKCSAGASVKNGQSPPPLYSWDGKGTAVPLGGAGAPGGQSAAPVTTSWVGVPTCIPCTGGAAPPTTAASASSSGASPAPGNSGAGDSTSAGKTLQQGVTQVADGGLVAAEKASSSTKAADSSGASSSPSPTKAPAKEGGDDLLVRRGDGTTTSNGQCCFTTWTPTVLGGGGATNTAKSTSSGLPKASGTPGALNPTAKPSGGGNLTAGNGTAAGGGNRTGNGTESSAWRRVGTLAATEGWTPAVVSLSIAAMLSVTLGSWTLL